MTIPKLAELKTMSDDEVISEYDKRTSSTVVGTAFFLDEIRFREANRTSLRMEKLTWAIAFMTLVVTIATIVNVTVFVAGR